MTAVLGISAFYHDSAAALIVDGEIVAAAQEERFTRIKHDPAFPKHAVEYCLSEAGITTADLDHVGFYEKPLLKFDRLLETYLSFAPLGFRSFLKAMPQWVGQKLHLRREIRSGLGGGFTGRICFCEHHESHAASAFYPSPFEEAAILTMIHRTDFTDKIIQALDSRFGAIEVFPLWPKEGVPSKRMVLRAGCERKSPMTLHSGLVLHNEDGQYTDEINTVLRDGQKLF